MAQAGPVVWVVDHGWHTDIGLPAAELTGPLAVYREVFPGADTIMFGFGKRTFMTAKVESLSEYIMGPVPGPGAMQVTGVKGLPGHAWPGRTILLALPPDGPARISAFLWDSLAKDQAGGPRLIAEGPFPGSVFYGTTRGYDLTYTCNTWTADALQQAGLPVGRDVILASGTLRQVARVAGACLDTQRQGGAVPSMQTSF